ncbi:MAG TPA: PHP domain-containing protein [Gemmatimonadales bacterium]|nr:PHP domain-containing protein [Gemmatimonadales bacterium]
MLLCDFHIHTTWSDGSVPLPDVVDLYGQAGFDVIAVTDHVYPSDNAIGAWAERLGKAVSADRFPDYLSALQQEADRALRRYGMLLIPGVEITKNYLSEQDSAHGLLVGIRDFISPDQSWLDIFREAREREALVVACHPYHTAHEFHDTLHFWNHRQEYTPHVDAWEVANRTDLFTGVSLGNLPILANSDFHKPQHLYSWKTLLPCEKRVDAVKDCIRDNRGVAITLFRNGTARE